MTEKKHVSLAHHTSKKKQEPAMPPPPPPPEENVPLEVEPVEGDVEEVPAVEEDPFAQSRGCSNVKPNCPVLYDNVSLLWGAIRDQIAEKEYDMEKNAAHHERMLTSSKAQSEALTNERNDLGTDLQEATAAKSAEESTLEEKYSEQRTLEKDYKDEVDRCQATIQEISFTDICGMKRVRSSIIDKSTTMTLDDIIDCEVSDFIPEVCSVPCDDNLVGGIQKLKRDTLVRPNPNGIQCPKIELELVCNKVMCPINCAQSDWSGWSECSKECGGGNRSRTRTITTEPKFGGEPCGVISEAETCNESSCDRDCSLHEWTAWGECSQTCDAGFQERFRFIHVPQRGAGKCPKPESDLRYEYQPCNDVPCMGDEECSAVMDLIVAIDGSGTIGKAENWGKLKNYAAEIVGKMKPEAYRHDAVKVGVLLFGNGHIDPVTKVVNPATQIMALGSDVDGAVAAIQGLTWQEGFTNMPQAMLLAKTMFEQGGRPDAQKKLLLVTDGSVGAKWVTKEQSKKLQEIGVEVSATVIQADPNKHVDFMKEVVSRPVDANLLWVEGGYSALMPDKSEYFARGLAQFCPRAESPQQLADEAYLIGYEMKAEGLDCASWWNDIGDFHYPGEDYRFMSVLDCRNVAREMGVPEFVYAVSGFYKGKCFTQKDMKKGECAVGFAPNDDFNLYHLVDTESEKQAEEMAEMSEDAAEPVSLMHVDMTRPQVGAQQRKLWDNMGQKEVTEQLESVLTLLQKRIS